MIASSLLLLASLSLAAGNAPSACEQKLEANQISMANIGDQRDAYKLEVKRLERLLKQCEKDVDRQVTITHEERAHKEAYIEVLEKELKRLKRAKRFESLKKWGGIIGAGYIGYQIAD